MDLINRSKPLRKLLFSPTFGVFISLMNSPLIRLPKMKATGLSVVKSGHGSRTRNKRVSRADACSFRFAFFRADHCETRLWHNY